MPKRLFSSELLIFGENEQYLKKEPFFGTIFSHLLGVFFAFLVSTRYDCPRETIQTIFGAPIWSQELPTFYKNIHSGAKIPILGLLHHMFECLCVSLCVAPFPKL